MLRRSACRLGRFSHDAQVIGADVPSFSRYPYHAQDVLQLYRAFWRMIYLHPPAERPDLAFRLRNEFRSKRYLAGPRGIGQAVRLGQGKLELYRQMMESRHVKHAGTHTAPRQAKWETVSQRHRTFVAGPAMLQPATQHPAPQQRQQHQHQQRSSPVLADALWERLKDRSGGVISGLRADISCSSKARETHGSVSKPYLSGRNLTLMPPRQRKLRHRTTLR